MKLGQVSANHRSQIRRESAGSSTMVFLIGDDKLTTSFGTVLTDSQVKNQSGLRSKTGTTKLIKTVYDKYSTTG